MAWGDSTAFNKPDVELGCAYAKKAFTDPANAAQATEKFDARSYKRITLFVDNPTNQNVAVQPRGYQKPGAAAAEARNIGAAVTVNAGAKGLITIEDTAESFFPWIDAQIDPVADATGTVTLELVAQR